MWCHSLLVIAGAQEMLWGRGIFLLDRRATACNLHIESCFWVGPSRCQQPQHTSPKPTRAGAAYVTRRPLEVTV